MRKSGSAPTATPAGLPRSRRRMASAANGSYWQCGGDKAIGEVILQEQRMSKKMFVESKNNEKAINYSIMEKHKYYRPDKKERKLIKDAFASIGKTIYGYGYDLIDVKTKRQLNEILKTKGSKKELNAKSITLYELKSNIKGFYGKKIIDEDFNGFQYGVSINEIRNFKELGNKFMSLRLNISIEFPKTSRTSCNLCELFVAKTNLTILSCKSMSCKDNYFQ